MTSASNGESLKPNTPFENQDQLVSDATSLRFSSGVGGDARARRLGRLDASRTAIFICDMQERFASSIVHFDTVVGNAERILRAANMLGVLTIATEQYPKVIHQNTSIAIAKLTFSD